jgi:hypothetical protein
MKTRLLTIACLLSLSVTAQKNAEKLVLEPGQKLVFNSIDTVKNKQSRGGETSDMNTLSKTKVEFVVLDKKPDYYLVAQTIKTMKLDFEGFGTKMTFDSEDPSKQSGMMVDQLKATVGKTDTVRIDSDGNMLEDAKEGKGAKGGRGGGGGMMRMMNQGGASLDRAFVVIPNGVTEGQGWKKDGMKDNLRTQTIYFVEKINGDMVELTFKRKTKGTRSFTTQNGPSQIEIDNLSEGALSVNRLTGRVKTYSEKAQTSSKMNMMGMDMPSTGTTSTLLNIE